MKNTIVKLIELKGLLGIVNAARASYAKIDNELDDKGRKLIKYLKDHKHFTPFAHPQHCFINDGSFNYALDDFTKEQLAGIEKYDNNWRVSKMIYDRFFRQYKPTEVIYNEAWLLEQNDLAKASRLPYLQFYIEAPIFVVRQLEKHQVGMVKNERSGRYTKFDTAFWKPEKWRKKSDTNKQGSKQDEFIGEKRIDLELPCGTFFRYNDIQECCKYWYDLQIENGMCAEQARAILPLSTYTSFVWTGSEKDFARLCSLRLKEDTQLETREIASQIYEPCKQQYPKTFDKIIEICNQERELEFNYINIENENN